MKKSIPTFLILLVIALFGCSSDDQNASDDIDNNESELYFPPINSDTWETLTTSELGWTESSLQPLYDLLDNTGTKAFIILKDGKIVIERYGNGADSSTNWQWNSAGKTLSAYTVGIAQAEGFLNINNASKNYLGDNWSSLTEPQEANITIYHHLTMTTGLDYLSGFFFCTDPECLMYLHEPGSFWYYYNPPYTLTQRIVEGAVGDTFNSYFNAKLRNPIGMQGAWVAISFNRVYYSNARSMARFGLLNLNDGYWDTTPILTDANYISEMTTTSQQLNKSYGYLWWLNGKESYKSPASTLEFPGKLIQNAPDDLIAALGKDDQKLYIVPSQNLVVVRLGEDAGEALLGPSSFDNELWEKISAIIN